VPDLKSISTLTARIAALAARSADASTALAGEAAAKVPQMDWDVRADLLLRLHASSGRTAEALSRAFSSVDTDANKT
jgi:hypothetical protein